MDLRHQILYFFPHYVIQMQENTCTKHYSIAHLIDTSQIFFIYSAILWPLLFLKLLTFVFQILTQEDWNVVLYNGMASTTPWAALYFVALMTFGNYVLFNLLVAILVEGFQAEVTKKKHLFQLAQFQ